MRQRRGTKSLVGEKLTLKCLSGLGDYEAPTSRHSHKINLRPLGLSQIEIVMLSKSDAVAGDSDTFPLLVPNACF